MYDKLNFYLNYFHVNDFNQVNFKKEVISIFQDNDPIYKYSFQLNSPYYLHLFQPNGVIINKLVFRLLSLSDDEDIIEDIYLDLYPSVNVYLKSLERINWNRYFFEQGMFNTERELNNLDFNKFITYPSYIGLYISSWSEDNLRPKDLASIKENYKNEFLLFRKQDSRK